MESKMGFKRQGFEGKDGIILKPLRKRNLPIGAKKFKPKDKPEPTASASKLPKPSRGIHGQLVANELRDNSVTVYQQEVIATAHSSEPEKTVYENPELEKSISTLEKANVPPKSQFLSKHREKTMIEIKFCERISKSDQWDLTLLKDLTEIVESVYHINHEHTDSLVEETPVYPSEEIPLYLFPTNAFDVEPTQPSYLFLLKETTDASKTLDIKKDPSAQVTNSDSYLQKYIMNLSKKNIKVPISPTILPTEMNFNLNATQIPYEEERQHTPVKSSVQKQDTLLVEDQEVVHQGWAHIEEEIDYSTYRSPSSIPSAISFRQKRPISLPLGPVLLGGLGPDLENEKYLEKVSLTN
jgi:hypothetical protein